MINRDPDYLTLELLPRKWGKALEKRGLDVTYSKGCMRIDASQGRVAELQVRRDGQTVRHVWSVRWTWFADQDYRWSYRWCKNLHEAGIWLEDFVWLAENWHDCRSQISIPWKELVLTFPVEDFKTVAPGGADLVGYNLQTWKRKWKNITGHAVTGYGRIMYSPRNDKPWALSYDHPAPRGYGFTKLYRFNTVDGLFNRAKNLLLKDI